LQGGLNVKVAKLPSGLDPADLILKEGKDVWSKAIREAKEIITFLLDVLAEHAKSTDNFRRSVESIVLPYLVDVSSPIARESHLREVAKRLGVSEHAVSEALAKVPKAPPTTLDVEREQSDSKRLTDRATHAYAILLWQRSLPDAQLDVSAYERDLEASVGTEALQELEALSEQEREKLRFTAEQMYGRSPTLNSRARSLLEVLLKERLSRELSQATDALRKAEGEGDEDHVAIHMKSTELLTQKIAELHKKG